MNANHIFENPVQKKQAHVEVAKKVEAFTRHEAIVLFEAAKKKLADVNHWHEVCCNEKANFKIMDLTVQTEASQPEIGNIIRIKPTSASESDSYDWARIEEFVSERNLLVDREVFGFRIRPISRPLNLKDNTNYFYTTNSTITFLVVRKGRVVTAMEVEKNEAEKDNIALIDKIKRIINSCAVYTGFTKPQWQSLINGILTKPTLNY